MAVDPPALMLKAIWLTHFVLSSWAFLSGFIAVNTYMYTHIAVLAFGFWAIVSIESVDAVIMFLSTLAISILNDILVLALYEPRAHYIFEESNAVSTSLRNEYRFALGMCITNLILKPLSIFLLYRIYQSRASGSDFDAGIPGLNTSSFGAKRGTYDNIESSPGHTSGYVRSGEPPLYQAPTYQEAPPMGSTEHVKT